MLGEAKGVPKEKVLPPDPGDPAWLTGTHAEHAAIWQKCCRPAELHMECKKRRGHQCNPHSTPGNPCNRAGGRRAEHVSDRRPLHACCYLAAASAIDKPSRAPSSSARQQNSSHSPTA